jgi:hypothetical protein
LARGTGLTLPLPNPDNPKEWEERVAWAARFLEKRQFLAVPIGEEALEFLEERFLRQVEERQPTIILPVYHSVLGDSKTTGAKDVRIVIGQALPMGTRAAIIRSELGHLADWVKQSSMDGAAPPTTLMIPAALGASPTAPAADHPALPS